MALARTVLGSRVPERSTCRITGVLKDETGAAVGSSQVATFKMTLFLAAAPFTLINDQADVDVKNANQGTLDVNGNFVLTLRPDDNQIVGPAADELHRLELVWTYGAGNAKSGRHQVDFIVANFDRVP